MIKLIADIDVLSRRGFYKDNPYRVILKSKNKNSQKMGYLIERKDSDGKEINITVYEHEFIKL